MGAGCAAAGPAGADATPPARPAAAVAEPGSPATAPIVTGGAMTGPSSAGSIASSCRWILVSSLPGSMPRSSASRFLVSPKTRSASACLPHRYRAIISSPVACSRSGCAAVSAVSSGTAAAACPWASSSSARSSIAVVRSSVSRRCSASANGPGTPA